MIKRLIAFCACLALFAGCATVDYQTKVSTIYLPTDRASHFCSDDSKGSHYIQLKSDGTYKKFLCDSMIGSLIIDDGTWNQNREGNVTLVSTIMCASVISSPFEVMIGRTEYIALLPELKKAISTFLRTNKADQFKVDVFEPIVSIGWDYLLAVRTNYYLEREFVSRAELQKLITAIDLFLADPTQQNRQAVPLKYKGRVFLLWLNSDIPCNGSLKEICSDIDKAKTKEKILNYYFLVSEEQFERKVKNPIVYNPETNKTTGAD